MSATPEPSHPADDQQTLETLAEDLLGIDLAKPDPEDGDLSFDDLEESLDELDEEIDETSDDASAFDGDDEVVSAAEPTDPLAASLEAPGADGPPDAELPDRDSQAQPEPAAAAQPTDEDDGYWDRLSDWDWDEDEKRGKSAAAVRENAASGRSGRARRPPAAAPAKPTYTPAPPRKDELLEDDEFAAGLLEPPAETTQDDEFPPDEVPEPPRGDAETSRRTARPEREDGEDASGRGRRRRRRRRRPRDTDESRDDDSEQVERTVAAPQGGSDEESDDFSADLDIAELDEEGVRAADRDDTAESRQRSGRRRHSRRRRNESPSAERHEESAARESVDAADDQETEDEVSSDAPESKEAYLNIPTWEQAISYLVKAPGRERSRPEGESGDDKQSPSKRGSAKPSGRRGRRRR